MDIDNRLGKQLSLPEKQVLQKMFDGYQEVIIKSAFSSGLSGSRVFLVRPVRADGAELPSVVKIDRVERIQQEWEAYRSCIQNKLPGIAEIRGEPVYPPGNLYGGLRYPLAGEGTFDVVSLSNYCRQASVDDVCYVLEARLFKSLSKLWKQVQVRAELHLQQCYDAFLPPNLVIASEPLPPGATPVWLIPETARQQSLASGDAVQLANFRVVRVNREEGILVLDAPRDQRGAYRLQIGPVENVEDYEADQVLSRPLTGRVAQTRPAFLQEQARAVLGSTIDLAAASLPLPGGVTLPNPLAKLPELLGRSFDAYVACIHADLNLENILVEPANRNAYLIDFVNSRRDHVLRDLLHLEIAITTHLLPEAMAEARLAAEAVIDLYQRLHCALQGVDSAAGPASLEKPFAILRTIRQAAQHHLFEDGKWDEYYCGLALYLLGALRYRDLDQKVNGLAPKAIAFWAAATTLKLLDSPPDCQKMWAVSQKQAGDKSVAKERPAEPVGTIHHQTNIYGPVIGPVHTGSGNIKIGERTGDSDNVGNNQARQAAAQQSATKPYDRIILRQMMASHFSLEEMRTLCYDLDIDFDDLPGSGKEGKIRELITYCERRGRVENLVDACREKRPHVNW
ncbi:MAG: aminoglycoside phosphotransferase family protein [Chloroflexi bacterium]|nr:aminoglycoside phosphotransferase family protein [Chloroflexota bacterium]